MCAVAMLAALGTQAIVERRLVLSRAGAVVPLILALLFLDYANHPMPLSREDLGTADLYKVIRSGGPGVVMELPVATPDRLPGWDVTYAFWSISHWHPLVNGYSGYHPADYLNTLMAMRTFPDNASIEKEMLGLIEKDLRAAYAIPDKMERHKAVDAAKAKAMAHFCPEGADAPIAHNGGVAVSANGHDQPQPAIAQPAPERPQPSGRREADVAIAAARRIRLAEVTHNCLLPAVPRVCELDHQLQLRAITALLFPQLGGVEFQLISPHLRFEQTRSADPPAGNVKAIEVTFAIEDVERRAQHHVVAFGTQPRRHVLD
jgi:hypothetical protein